MSNWKSVAAASIAAALISALPLFAAPPVGPPLTPAQLSPALWAAQASSAPPPAGTPCSKRPVPGARASVDEIAIANVMAEYVFRLDAHDFEGYGCLFEHGAFMTPDGKVVAKGAKDVEALVRNTKWPPELVVRHLVWNKQIVVDANRRTAAAKSFFITFRAMPGQDPYIFRIATYNDRFEKAQGAWRFVSRSEESAWVKQ